MPSSSRFGTSTSIVCVSNWCNAVLGSDGLLGITYHMFLRASFRRHSTVQRYTCTVLTLYTQYPALALSAKDSVSLSSGLARSFFRKQARSPGPTRYHGTVRGQDHVWLRPVHIAYGDNATLWDLRATILYHVLEEAFIALGKR